MKTVGFLICSGIGYLIGHYMGSGALAAYLSILVSYHLYLGFLVMMAEKEASLSMPMAQTLITHAACLALVIGIAMGRHSIPFFGLIRLFIPGIAPFEVNWLFSGGRKKSEPAQELLARILPMDSATAQVERTTVADAPAEQAAAAAAITFGASTSSLFSNSTGEEYEEFLALLHQGKRPFRKPGQAIRDEYEAWLAHRAKHPVAAGSNRQTA